MNDQLKKISKTRYRWCNITGHVTATPMRYFYPVNVQDIRDIILEAESKKLRVRAVGSGHSFSEAAKGTDFVMDIKELRDAAEYTSPLKDDRKNNRYVLADAGITIRRLNKLLDKKKLALENMGAVDFQTISGALMTGTHGTGIKKPAFPDIVESLRIVSTGGELIQIEPANGITDPAKHDHAVRLIQDDDIFYSTVVSFGAMGIVYQIVIQAVPKFFIHEHRYLDQWSEVKQQMLSGEFMKMVEKNDFVAFRINPYKIKGDHLCSIVQQNVDPSAIRRKGRRNIIASIFGNHEAVFENLIKTDTLQPQRVRNKIQLSLRMTKVKSYTDRSFKILFQSGAASLRYGISSEFAFHADPNKIIEVLEYVFARTVEYEEYAEIYHPSYLAVRFVKQSKAYLSSCNRGVTVYIDIPTLYSTIGYQSLLERYQDIMIDKGGIPHWGKVNNKLYHRMEFIFTEFPKAHIWSKVQKQMDPKGTFL
ncbi:MAG: FAD-binding protein, partial [Saprospiraceae bacterium]